MQCNKDKKRHRASFLTHSSQNANWALSAVVQCFHDARLLFQQQHQSSKSSSSWFTTAVVWCVVRGTAFVLRILASPSSSLLSSSLKTLNENSMHHTPPANKKRTTMSRQSSKSFSNNVTYACRFFSILYDIHACSKASWLVQPLHYYATTRAPPPKRLKEWKMHCCSIRWLAEERKECTWSKHCIIVYIL